MKTTVALAPGLRRGWLPTISANWQFLRRSFKDDQHALQIWLQLIAEKLAVSKQSQDVGIHALINVHEYHCVAIRMRCWLVDD
jgi:hypothetical protein